MCPCSINGEDAPTLDAVLIAGMRELAALEEEDMAELTYPPSGKEATEGLRHLQTRQRSQSASATRGVEGCVWRRKHSQSYISGLSASRLQDSRSLTKGFRAGLATKEAVVEVVCHTEFKTQVTYRVKGPLSDMQSTALCSAMRRLNNLQKSAVSPHDPVSSTLAAAVVAGLLTWDRDL